MFDLADGEGLGFKRLPLSQVQGKVWSRAVAVLQGQDHPCKREGERADGGRDPRGKQSHIAIGCLDEFQNWISCWISVNGQGSSSQARHSVRRTGGAAGGGRYLP